MIPPGAGAGVSAGDAERVEGAGLGAEIAGDGLGAGELGVVERFALALMGLGGKGQFLPISGA